MKQRGYRYRGIILECYTSAIVLADPNATMILFDDIKFNIAHFWRRVTPLARIYK